MLTADFFSRYQVLPRAPWEGLVGSLFGGMERLTGLKVSFEGTLPEAGPVLIATNSTQKYDFMPIRVELRRRGIKAVTVTKAKNYHSGPARFVLSRVGVVPVSSRGYLLVADFLSVHGRRPEEAEYRALRRHLVDGDPLPAGEPYEALQRTPRALLGLRFDPGAETYRVAVQRVHDFTMAETVRLSREAATAGYHVQMYPEGTVSRSLGQGRSGVVQLAQALSLPVVPCGMNGCAEGFVGKSARTRKGHVVVRFGAPLQVDGLPSGFRPFHADDEQTHQAALERQTERVMAGIEALLDPQYRRGAQVTTDASQGTHRFV